MILIIEDDSVSRRALQSLLQLSGYQSMAVGSAEEAKWLVSNGARPRVALVDVDLPGSNGLELISWLEKTAPDIVPMLVTAMDTESVDAFRHRHHCAFFRKPLDLELLLQNLGESHAAN